MKRIRNWVVGWAEHPVVGQGRHDGWTIRFAAPKQNLVIARVVRPFSFGKRRFDCRKAQTGFPRYCRFLRYPCQMGYPDTAICSAIGAQGGFRIPPLVAVFAPRVFPGYRPANGGIRAQGAPRIPPLTAVSVPRVFPGYRHYWRYPCPGCSPDTATNGGIRAQGWYSLAMAVPVLRVFTGYRH